MEKRDNSHDFFAELERLRAYVEELEATCDDCNWKYRTNEAEADLERLRRRVTVLEKALEATKAVKAFMVMPRDYWDDAWKEETEKRYYAAEKRMKEAYAALAQAEGGE